MHYPCWERMFYSKKRKKKKKLKAYLELVKPIDRMQNRLMQTTYVTSPKLRANVGFLQRTSPTEVELPTLENSPSQ